MLAARFILMPSIVAFCRSNLHRYLKATIEIAVRCDVFCDVVCEEAFCFPLEQWNLKLYFFHTEDRKGYRALCVVWNIHDAFLFFLVLLTSRVDVLQGILYVVESMWTRDHKTDNLNCCHKGESAQLSRMSLYAVKSIRAQTCSSVTVTLYKKQAGVACPNHDLNPTKQLWDELECILPTALVAE